MFRKLSLVAAGMLAVFGIGAGSFYSNSTNLSTATEAFFAEEQTKFLQGANDNLELVDIQGFDSTAKFTLNSATKSPNCQTYAISIRVDESSPNSFYLGYYGEGEQYKPLTFSYQATDSAGTTKTYIQEATLTSTVNPFDGIGVKLAGTNVFTSNADLSIAKDMVVKPESLRVYNVFKYDESNRSPIFDTNYYIDCTLSPRAKTNYELNRFLIPELSGTSTFTGYFNMQCKYEAPAYESYKDLYSRWGAHEEAVASGEEFIRARIVNLAATSYKLNYSDGTSVVRKITGTDAFSLSRGGVLNFLLKGVRTDGLSSLELLSATVAIDLVSTANHKTMTGSEIKYRFGSIPFALSGNQTIASNISYDLVMWLSFGIFLIAFIGCDYALYRYRKEKYKNDEFNRVDPKHFIKRSVLAGFYLELWLLEIVALAGRGSAMHNTLVVKNPFDIFIVVISVLLIIFTGYYIKYFIAAFKDNRTKKRAAALKLDEDKDDDGTK